MRLNFDSWFKRRILHVPNWIEIKLNNLCLLEWEFKTRHSRSAILFGKTIRRINQISRMYLFESTKISIWFGACKMRRLNQALGITCPSPRRELSRLGEPKHFHEEKLSHFPGLPYLPRWDHQRCLASRDGFAIGMKTVGWFCKEIS